MKFFFSAIVLALTAFAANAAPDEQVVQRLANQSGLLPREIRDSYHACDSGVTLLMKICRAYRLTEQEVRLDHLYKEARARARQQKVEEAIVKAQEACIAYRAAQCPFEGQWNAAGGTAEGLYVLSCQIELTKQQADRLKTIVPY